MLAYKVLHAGTLEQTALFYVGLPAFIALSVAVWAQPKSSVGMAVAVVTVALLLAAPLLGEGVVCLLVAAPLFYFIAVVVGLLVAHGRRRAVDDGGPRAAVVAPFALLFLIPAVEGTGAYEMPRDASASATITVDASPASYRAALAESPDFDDPRSLFLQIPFPRPLEVDGTGLDVGDERQIRFERDGAMTLVVASSTENGVRFTVEDDTALDRWMSFDAADVSWRATPDGRTEVTWTLHYRRTFDPGWYFGPVQKYGMTEAAEYLARAFV
jgi:hypothetical protein